MSSTVRVLFFAGARERVGVDAMDVSTNDAPTINALRRYLADRHAALTPLLPNVVFAVNEEYANDDVKLNARDIVAVIPPVSGG